MTPRARPLRALALAAAALALAPAPAAAQTCSDAAARDLLAASYLDTALNPPLGEDLDFLYRDAGLPNIMVLFDSSVSMRRLPPDGPAHIGGTSPTLPPGVLLSEPSVPGNQLAAAALPRTVGCGLDPVSRDLAGFMDSQTMQGIMQRRFYTPCGTATHGSLVGAPYAATYGGVDSDYAKEMNTCPYYTSSNNQTYVASTEAAGYDPEFYNNAAATDTTKNGKPVFFGRGLVFHDTVGTEPLYDFDAARLFKHNFGDGWSDTAVYPFEKSNNQTGTIAEFCALQGGSQGTLTRESICNTCLAERGWYYDGFLLDTTEDGVTTQYPSLWYTGNYLNFFPPKFLAARKVVKDLIAVQSRVRMAITRFDPTGEAGASFVQDLNPSCQLSYGSGTSSFDSNRTSYISDLNSDTKLSFTGGAPLSRALFDIGRYYHSPTLPWFGADWDGVLSPSNSNQYSVCYSCQVSTVIVLSDGVPDVDDGSTLPPSGTTIADTSGKYAGDASTGILGITSPACPWCNKFSGTQDYLNNPARVAWYLNKMDLRQNTEDTLDCKRMGGKQTIQTYTVGFGTGQLPVANTVLRNTADAGGGIFVGAEDPSALKEGLNYILQQISTRSTSFSVATVSTLQTTSGRAVIVPRFDPNQTAHWDGHLYRYDLYSEFVNQCTPGGEGDLDCDGQCVSAFLVDDSGTDDNVSLVSEDGNGSFVRNEPSDQPICSQAPACGTSCAVPGNTGAEPFWDAGAALAAQSWKDRNVWTVVDSADADTHIDANDAMVKLSTATDTAADAIVPYLALGTSATGQSVCGNLASMLNAAGNTARATTVSTSKTECAKTIIRYVLGADVFNSKGKTAPLWPPASEEDLWDRDYKLGDIFHSSPVVVDPPLPRDGILCKSGLSNQCISSLWGTPTQNGEAGYDAYAKSTTYQNRRKIILVGANDGLLHAFNGGEWKGNPTPGRHNAAADDPFTTAVDESLPPFNGYYERGNEDGAIELWAFLPPDLLAKLPLLMATRHQYFVDGTAMVRDVWVDGTSNSASASAAIGTRNDRKEGGEFHTVAVVGERRGGTRYFALDVTNATEAGATTARAPKFLWMYPQPGDRRSLEMGETYSDFLPVAPPVGPVRIAADGDHPKIDGVTPEMAVSGTTDPVPYHERWVTILSGGFDPQYLRGRGVYMVDVWTGKELWDFSYPRDPAAATAGDPRLALRYPVAATVGMVPWGQAAQRASDETNDRFFDTATFGDTGGQLWVLRFSAPGTLTGGKVTNWLGARVFQMGGAGDCALCGAQPFFYITANMPLPTNMAYRVFAGTGDRFNLLDKDGGTCGPDNIRACVLRGCTVTMSTSSNFLQSTGAGKVASGLTQAACTGAFTPSRSDSTITACGAAGRARIEITGCPGSLATTSDFEVSCEQMTDGYRCTQVRSTSGAKLPISIADAPITLGNWYLSLLVFDADGDRAIFSTPEEAQDYDAARLWITQTGATTRSGSTGIVMMSATDDAPAATATATSNGWALYYDHDGSITIDNHTFTVAWQDERTSSASAVGEGLITWNATQPTKGEVQQAVTSSCKVSKCTAESRRVAFHYAADPETGAPFQGFKVGNQVVRSIASYLLVPSQADQTTVFVNQRGQVAVGLTSVNPEKGATNVGMGDPIDPTTDMGVVEVSEELHACRHADTEAEAVCR